MTNYGKNGWAHVALRAGLCLLLSCALALGLLPGMTQTALAAENDRIYVGENYIDISAGHSGGGTGWYYDADQKTLTLTNLNLFYEATGGRGAISYSGTEPLTLVLVGSNTVTRKISGSSNGYRSYAMQFPNADITIRGEGSLICTGGLGELGSYGIYAKNLTIESGNVTAIGEETFNEKHNSYGLYATGNLTIKGGTVNATGGDSPDADRGNSAGISAATITIQGGIVTATGGEANDASDGIRGGNVDISGGVVTAKGGQGQFYSNGIEADGKMVTISGGTVEAVGGEGAEGYSAGIRGKVTIKKRR